MSAAPETSLRPEVAKLEAAERRLRRLALDLHDGPAQDLAALSADAALLEAELQDDLSPERVDAVRALAGEIRARLAALSREIRDLAEVLEPRSMLREPLATVLARQTASYARQTGIVPTLEVEDDLGVMTASQQIALARVAREALANAAKHARATTVHLTAAITPRGVTLSVVDDGGGFDVARARRSAAERGRLGLAGMHERVRLLGGTLAIESRPGGPTRVTATVPRGRPG
jgi:two-component system, NarL family, sensor kinase